MGILNGNGIGQYIGGECANERQRVVAAAAALDQARFEDFAAGRFRFPTAEGEAR